jgi:Tat protein secretion system quality control protein TatD with DNase activity
LDTLEAEGNAEIGATIHGFSKSPEYVKRCVGMGIFLSVGHRSLTADNLELFETIKQTPIEWVLTKTASDDPEGFLKLT